jgi:hypothetical protein
LSVKRVVRRIPVYLYRSESPIPGSPEWGTMTGIFALEGCTPITRSARLVDAKAVGRDGFLPRGVEPDDLEAAQDAAAKAPSEE